MAAVTICSDLEPRKIKSATVSIVSPSICNEVMGLLFDHAKAFDCVDHNKLWKIFQEMGIPDPLTSWEICMQVKKQHLELDMEQQTGSKSGKEYIEAVYYHLLI